MTLYQSALSGNINVPKGTPHIKHIAQKHHILLKRYAPEDGESSFCISILLWGSALELQVHN